jgi:hypothetical protein
VLPSLSEAPGFQPHAGPRVVNWIDEGRDVKLEQVMLAQIQARLAVAVGPAYVAPTGVPVGPTY